MTVHSTDHEAMYSRWIEGDANSCKVIVFITWYATMFDNFLPLVDSIISSVISFTLFLCSANYI